MKQKVKKIPQVLIKNFGIILVLILSFWAIKPLLSSGFFPIHDDTQVARVFEMGKALKDGMFPVRWVPDLGYGYGYPIFNFYAPLVYYFGGLLILIGFDALIATKIMMIVGILLAGIFMYFLAREFWGVLGGVLSGLFYVYAPYHALDIYVRGDIAEFWAYALIPLMFWGVYKVLYNSPSRSRFGTHRLVHPFATPRRWRGQVPDGTWRGNDLDSFEVDIGNVWKWVVIGAIGYAAVILSHNLTAMMITPFLLIVILLYCYIAYKNKNLSTIYYLLSTIFLGLAISAFYWIPALFEMKYTNVLSQVGAGADFRDHFVCIGQLWTSPWGFGGSTSGCVDGLSFKIGKLHILAVFFSLLIFIGRIFLPKSKFSHSKDINHYSGMTRLVTLLALGLMISIFFTLEISKPIWEAIPVMAFFQYPWRFLLLASFFSSLLVGSLVMLLINLKIKPYLTAFILIFFLLVFNIKLFNPQTILSKTAEDYTNEIALKWTASKTSDEYLPPNFKKPKSEREIAKRPAIRPQETQAQKISNIISLIGALGLIAGIIFTRKFHYE